MKKIIIIGKNSYIASGIANYFDNFSTIKYLTHNNWKKNINDLIEADYILNFCIEPDFSTNDNSIKNNIDYQIANSIQFSNAKLVFISSRKVYGTSNSLIIHKEDDHLSYFDIYSKKKILLENSLKEILGDNLLILRISNVIGTPIFRNSYKTFIGWISSNYICNGKLMVNQNVESVKDFVTTDYIQSCIYKLVCKNATGAFNLSAGFGISVKDVIEGYVGKENIVYGDNICIDPADQFILDNAKLIDVVEQKINREDIDNKLLSYREILSNLRLKYMIS